MATRSLSLRFVELNAQLTAPHARVVWAGVLLREGAENLLQKTFSNLDLCEHLFIATKRTQIFCVRPGHLRLEVIPVTISLSER